MKLLMASRNQKKCRELAEILGPHGLEVVSLTAFPHMPAVSEDGATFEDNAVRKARAARDASGMWALADDSGLCVDILRGEPGVRSARYAGEGATDQDNNRLLLARLASVPDERRSARFVCVIALALPFGAAERLGADILFFRGEARGYILRQPRGSNGFGYDPLFLSADLGITFAEATASDKHSVSHRGRALAAFLACLHEIRAKAE